MSFREDVKRVYGIDAWMDGCFYMQGCIVSWLVVSSWTLSSSRHPPRATRMYVTLSGRTRWITEMIASFSDGRI